MFVILLLLFSSPQTYAGDLTVKTGETSFVAIGKPGAIRIHGTGSPAHGTLSEKGGSYQGDITLDLDSLDTGISLRNEHMKKKYLQTDKFPKAAVKVTKFVLPFSPGKELKKFDELPGEAVLTLHGVSRPIVGKVTGESSATQFKAKIIFQIQLSDFGIDVPQFAGIKVADHVEFEQTIDAEP